RQRHTVSSRRLMVMAVGLVVALIVGGVIARNAFITDSANHLLHSTPATVRLDLNALGYTCPAAMTWSPDGSKLAVLAQRGSITSGQETDPCASDTILVFDTQ